MDITRHFWNILARSLSARDLHQRDPGHLSSLNGYGIKKFYVINTGVSTLRPLKKAAAELAGRKGSICII